MDIQKAYTGLTNQVKDIINKQHLKSWEFCKQQLRDKGNYEELTVEDKENLSGLVDSFIQLIEAQKPDKVRIFVLSQQIDMESLMFPLVKLEHSVRMKLAGVYSTIADFQQEITNFFD